MSRIRNTAFPYILNTKHDQSFGSKYFNGLSLSTQFYFSDLKLKLTFTLSKNVLLAEDQLQVVYLHSCVLAEYLLTAEFTSLQTISRDLNLDPSDIPLLLVGQNIGEWSVQNFLIGH